MSIRISGSLKTLNLIILQKTKSDYAKQESVIKLTSLATLSVKKLKGLAGVSPNCFSSPSKLIEALCSLGGVPVFNRASTNPASFNDRESEFEAGSPILPNGVVSNPIWDSPPKKVPVDITTDLHEINSPESEDKAIA